MFVLGKFFQPSLIYLDKIGDYLSNAHSKGRLLALPIRTRLVRNKLCQDEPSSLFYRSVSDKDNESLITMSLTFFFVIDGGPK